jgi:hypothetical protein
MPANFRIFAHVYHDVAEERVIGAIASIDYQQVTGLAELPAPCES